MAVGDSPGGLGGSRLWVFGVGCAAAPLSTFSPAVVETDNTLTIIILSVVGGLIGLLILFMLIKRVVLFIIKKTQDGK